MTIPKETLREAVGTLLGRLRAFEPEDDDLAVDEVIAALPHLAQPCKSDEGRAAEYVDWYAETKSSFEPMKRDLLTALAAVRAEAMAAKDAEIAALRSAMEKVGQLISYAGQDAVSPVIAESNRNQAWHMLVAALNTPARAALEMSGGVK